MLATTRIRPLGSMPLRAYAPEERSRQERPEDAPRAPVLRPWVLAWPALHDRLPVSAPIYQFPPQMLRPLPAFQAGGQFTVGGSGGVDSRLVQFLATPGEQVTVNPPGQAPGTTNVIIQNFGGSQIETERRQNAQGGEDIYVMIDRMVARALNKPGGRSEQAMKQRFGSSPGLIGR